MDTEDLRSFRLVYEERSINQAARHLFISPQGLSRIIQKLEEELHSKLFERTPSGMVPTKSGDYFYEHSQEILYRLEDLKIKMQQIDRADQPFRIGFACGVLNILPLQKLKQISAEFPQILIQWEELANSSMSEKIASGKADIVYMARALLADPFLPRKIMENREDEIVRCLRCYTCMAERAMTSTRRCTVNPLIGREIEGDEIHPAPVKKKVLVAGGGPGGLYAAYTAARRGHEVILCEKEAELGRILKSEQAISFKQEMYQLAGTYAHFAKNAGVVIRTSTEVTPEYVEKEAPDALIVAVGSEPLIPPIKGKEVEKYATAHTGYRGLEVTSEGVLCENTDHEQVLVPGTSVICALGQRSRSKLADSLRDCAPYVAIIGDASRVSTITNAVYDGYHAALDI